MHFKNATLYVGNCNKEQKLSYNNFCSLLQLPTYMYNVAFLKCIKNKSCHITTFVLYYSYQHTCTMLRF